jgi:hypothetical protein
MLHAGRSLLREFLPFDPTIVSHLIRCWMFNRARALATQLYLVSNFWKKAVLD